MSSKSKRLGSLADIFQSETLEGTIRKIKLSKIIPSERQPRLDRLKGVEELSESLKNEGLLQPIVVNKIENEDSYNIIAGERRFHAATKLGWIEIECKILNKNKKDTYRIAVIENLQRENLSAYEEAESLKILKTEYSYSDLEIATIFGKSRNYVSEILSIATLSKDKIKKCKEAGIENKNLLIQAALAEKKGDFDSFLSKFASGKLKTVKDAKLFNKKELKPESQPTKITRSKDRLIITSKNQELLSILEIKIKEILAKF